MSEESRAIEEVAKTAGKFIDATVQFCEFISSYTKEPLEQVKGIFVDKLKYYKWENQMKLMIKANDFSKLNGLSEPNEPIKLKFAVPLLEAASMEDDDYLQDLWAKLLVNSANKESNVELTRNYIDILEHLSPFEAKILEKIYSLPFEEIQHEGVATKNLPETVDIATNETYKDVIENEKLKLALANLAMLGCISLTRTVGGGEFFGIVNPTILGKYFIKACTLRNEIKII